MKRTILATGLMILVLVVASCGGPAPSPTAAPVSSAEETEPTEATDTAMQTEPTGTEADEPETDETEPAAAQPTPTVAAAAAPTTGGKLATIKQRGKLICGVNGGLPGFSNTTPDGDYVGFDADFCRAVAAAIFGTADAIEFRPLTAQERFTALQTGEVDVLFRNTTWTLNRDTAVGLDFGPVIFYDGQGIMVLRELNVTSLEELAGGTICVQSGTTTELNLTDQFRAWGIEYVPVVLDDIDTTYNTYDQGGCDAVTSDRSQLTARRAELQNPDDHVILTDILSSEPLAPAVAQGDSQWLDVVRWVVFATFQAEEFGIDSTNVDEFLSSENPEIRRFLGTEGELGTDLGLDTEFTVNVIRSVGNYAEIYNRNLGPDTPFNLDRGLNSIPSEGGLLFSPPFR